MSQHSPMISQQSGNGNRGSRSKHFLSRFLGTSPQIYVHSTTPTNTPSTTNTNAPSMIPDDTNLLTHAITKSKKNKGIGKRMLKRFTSKSDNHGSTLRSKDTSLNVQHHSLPSARTNLSTPITGRYPPDYDGQLKNGKDHQLTTNKNTNTNIANDSDRAQRRRSATMPSVFYSCPNSAERKTTTITSTKDACTEQRVPVTDDGGSVYSAFTGTIGEADDNDQTGSVNSNSFSTKNDIHIQDKQLDMNNKGNDDEYDDGSSSSDESFVDASDELYSDLGGSVGKKKRSSLTHRLSAGRFGSAGGLVVNMHPSLQHHRSRQFMAQQQQPRNSVPPDDLAQVMLDWKRKSVGDGTINKRFSTLSDFRKTGIVMTANTNTTIMESQQTSTTSQPLIRATIPAELESEDDEHDSPELSKEDKEALRAHTANILMGNDSKRIDNLQNHHLTPAPTPTPAHSPRLHHERSRSIKALSEMFSRSLDEAWNNDTSSQELVDQVRDPRLSNTWNRPTHLSTKAKETAKRIWDCDESILPVDHYAEWLGQSTKYNVETLVCYMDLFYFADMKLDSAFRKLCSKLYFKAEAQQIDRILEVFAHRYWDCNPRSNFKCADVVYAVVYSLLLLNTDLHVAQGNHHRMTKQEFNKNTMLAIHSQLRLHPEIEPSAHFDIDMEKYLKELYISVKNYQILQPMTDDNAATVSSGDIKSTGNSLRHVESLKRGVSSIIRKAGRESMMLTNYETPPMTRPTSPLSASRISMQHSPLPSTATTPYRMSTTTRRLSRSLSLRQASTLTTSAKYHSNGSLTSIGSSTISSLDGSTSKPNDDNTRQSKRNTGIINNRRLSSASPTLPTVLFTPGTFLHDAPYAKESVVMCKHLLESSEQKAKSREWREQLMVVDDQGVIKLYDLPGQKENERMAQGSMDLLRPHHIRNTKKYTEGPLSRFNPSWNDLLVLTIDLKHTLSNVLPPPGYNKIRQHVFAFQQPNGGVYLFQGTSLDDVASWVSTCNYWAARQSKEPLQGGVGSMDYGWGECLNNVIVDLDAIQNGDSLTGNTVGGNDADSLVIYDWQPPVAPGVPSNYTDDPTGQLEALCAHLRWLNAEINAHREIKTKMLVRFPKRSFNYKRALSNWSLKSSYLLGDIIKYQHYCDSLENSMQLSSPASGLSNGVNLGIGPGALDNVGLIDFHDMDLIKEIENELDL